MKIKTFFQILAAIAICELAGLIGTIFTFNSVNTWYVTLVKPALNPPSWVFGPVWTTLYALMGIAAFIIWNKGRPHNLIDPLLHPYAKRNSRRALRLFGIQLVLNAIWSIIFFGAKNPGAALIEITLMWIAIVLTTIVFYRISKTAAYLMIPYILWVSFATYLNAGIWLLN